MKNPGSSAAPKRIAGADRRQRQRGTAALEFALVAPLLLLLIGGVANYGWAMWSAGALSNAVSQGAYYSFLNGTKVSAASIESFVQSASGLSGVTAFAGDEQGLGLAGSFPLEVGGQADDDACLPKLDAADDDAPIVLDVAAGEVGAELAIAAGLRDRQGAGLDASVGLVAPGDGVVLGEDGAGRLEGRPNVARGQHA